MTKPLLISLVLLAGCHAKEPRFTALHKGQTKIEVAVQCGNPDFSRDAIQGMQSVSQWVYSDGHFFSGEIYHLMFKNDTLVNIF